MSDLDLEALREVLNPLDLTLHFAVVGGDHLFGLAAPDSEVRVRAGHVEALTASLGSGRRAARVELELVDRALSVHIVSDDLTRLERLMEKGDPRLLEELHSPVVVAGAEEVRHLRSLARGLVSERLTRRYAELARRAAVRLAESSSLRAGPLLHRIRALLAGIHVLTRGEILPDLPSLVRAHGLDHLRDLARRPDPRAVVADPARFGFYLDEADRLAERFAEAVRDSTLPAAPEPSPALEAYFRRARDRE